MKLVQLSNHSSLLSSSRRCSECLPATGRRWRTLTPESSVSLSVCSESSTGPRYSLAAAALVWSVALPLAACSSAATSSRCCCCAGRSGSVAAEVAAAAAAVVLCQRRLSSHSAVERGGPEAAVAASFQDYGTKVDSLIRCLQISRDKNNFLGHSMFASLQ